MFTRRHPFLFFLLVFVGILSVTSIVNTLISAISDQKKSFSGQKVGIVEIKQVIFEAEPILDELKRFRERRDIQAIVVRLDTPGGAVGPSQEIYREIRKTIEVKPVIASMGAIAASGGYYVAAATNGIMANAGTITGSIGVIMETANFQELLDKIGVYPVVIKSGPYKNIGSPLGELSKAGESILQEFVDTVHQQFVEDVAVGRNMEIDAVAEVADGRIFPGAQAMALGLVDQIGNLPDAIEWAGRKGGIEGRVEAVYPPEDRLSVIRRLLEAATDGIVSAFSRTSIRTIGGGYVYEPSRN